MPNLERQQALNSPSVIAEARQIYERHQGNIRWEELLVFILLNLGSHIFKHQNPSQPPPSVIFDGPVGSGTTTAAENWHRYFNSWVISFGGCMRAISYLAAQNGYTAEQVVAAAAQDQLHFALKPSGDGNQLEVVSTVPDRQFAQRLPDDTSLPELRAQVISEFTSELNTDPAKNVERVVVQAIRHHSQGSGGGLVIEGRNVALTVNRGAPDNQRIGAYYLAVSDAEAVRRSHGRLRAQKAKKGQVPTAEELAAAERDVYARNERDRNNGTLLTWEQALATGEYTAVFNTDLAGPLTLFFATVMQHGLLYDYNRNNNKIVLPFKPTLMQDLEVRTVMLIMPLIHHSMRNFYRQGRRFIYYPDSTKNKRDLAT